MMEWNNERNDLTFRIGAGVSIGGIIVCLVTYGYGLVDGQYGVGLGVGVAGFAGLGFVVSAGTRIWEVSQLVNEHDKLVVTQTERSTLAPDDMVE
jgi:hypothetical protein